MNGTQEKPPLLGPKTKSWLAIATALAAGLTAGSSDAFNAFLYLLSSL